MVQLHLIFAIRWLQFITCYLWLAIWIFLSETCYFLQKLVPFARCCTSRNFFNLSIKVPPNCENYMKLVAMYGNFISKCPSISENMAPILAHMVLLNGSYSKILCGDHYETFCIFGKIHIFYFFQKLFSKFLRNQTSVREESISKWTGEYPLSPHVKTVSVAFLLAKK